MAGSKRNTGSAGPKKGAALEELIRAYFQRQGYLAVRSVVIRFEGEDVTDVDVWLYGRQAASGRIRAVVDAKDKRTPKALERILWTKGLQAVLGADRAIVVTTDTNPRLPRFARDNKVSLITKGFLDRLSNSDLLDGQRLTLEQFVAHIEVNAAHRQDGDWLRRLDEAKSALCSTAGFGAVNSIMSTVRFFGERLDTRPLYREQVLRSFYLSCSLAAAALDAAIERISFDALDTRQRAIFDGVALGDNGDGRVQKSILNVLDLIGESMDNGRAIAGEARRVLEQRFASVRADIVSEFFAKEQNAQNLFPVARELESKAFSPMNEDLNGLSLEAKGYLGVVSDFIGVKRTTVFRSTAALADHASSGSGESKADKESGVAERKLL